MALNANWPIWIASSVSEYINNNRGSTPLFVEGQERDTEDLKDFYELRVNGPDSVEVQKDVWNLYFEVNIIVQSIVDGLDLYRHRRLEGAIASKLTNIPIYDYDTDELIECAKILQDRKGRDLLEINNFGQIDPEKRIIQSCIEAHYMLRLTV